MKRVRSDKLPLLRPWLTWQQLPELGRERALDVLTAICLETVSSNPLSLEPDDHDRVHH